jgi:hypothetical protein
MAVSIENKTAEDHTRDQFLSRVESLYAKLKKWLGEIDDHASINEESVVISEEPGGAYSAPVLVIERPGYKAIRFIPRGRWIVGAEGRVDVKSSLGTEALIYVQDGGPVVRAEMFTESGKVLGHESPLAGDVAEGWVLIQNRALGLMPSLDAFLLGRLLEVLGK